MTKTERISIVDKKLEEYGITNPYMKNAVLGVIMSEGGLSGRSENLNYTSAGRLAEVWSTFSNYKNSKGQTVRAPKGQGSKYANELAKSGKYLNNPEALGNFIYGNRMGNNNSGDGYKYRGRGLNQLTGKEAYESLGNKLGIDLVNNPELLEKDPELQAEVAIKFLADRLNKTLPRLVKTNSKYAKKFPKIDYNNFDNQEDATFLVTSANAGFGTTLKPETLNKRLAESKKFNLDGDYSTEVKEDLYAKEDSNKETKTPIKTNWWDFEEEEVVQAPVAQEPEVYSQELPFGLLSELDPEYQQALFGEQMFDKGGIVRPDGDPWEYKKQGDKYLTRKRGNKTWIATEGIPEEAIKSKIFKEKPTSNNVRKTNKMAASKKSVRLNPETGRYEIVQEQDNISRNYDDDLEASVYYDDEGTTDGGTEDYSDVKTWQDLQDKGLLSEIEQEKINEAAAMGYAIDLSKSLDQMPWEETQVSMGIEAGGSFIDPKTYLRVPANTPGAVFKSKKELERMVDNQKATAYEKVVTNPLAAFVYGDDMEAGQMAISEGLLGMDADDDSWSKFAIDMGEYLAPDVALYKLAPKAFAPIGLMQLFGMGISAAADYGYNDFWKEKYGDMTGTQYIERDIADEWERTKNAYTDQQGKFKLDSWMKRDLNKVFGAGDLIEDVGQGIQSGYNATVDFAEDAYDAVGDFAEDAYDTVADGLSNAWDWATDWQDGGAVELTKQQAERYARMGYIVEEIK